MERLKDWIARTPIAVDLLWRDAALAQFDFVQWTLGSLLFTTSSEAEDATTVIATHSSKSVPLPVYQIRVGPVRLVMRGNFYDWKASIDSEVPLELDLGWLLSETGRIARGCCEGFPDGDIFGPYEPGALRFTLALPHEHAVWAFCLALKRAVR